MDVKIDDSWKSKLSGQFTLPYFEKLVEFVKSEYSQKTIYPHGSDIFRAFELCKFDDVKVVIVGQDPYHGPNQAMGLSFSVPNGVKTPPSLQNIYKEIESDLSIKVNPNGNLSRWAKNGVLLLNATLTVVANQAGSHQNKGWEIFTDAVIELLNREKKGLVFMLWGNYAKKKGANIDTSKHLVLNAAHPSPFSAYSGFFGCKHFCKCNEFLVSKGEKPIDWS